jgi:Molybdopterin-binding domain of aldehyde dehydrogenase
MILMDGFIDPSKLNRGHFCHPLRWLEDCREQLSANANCREHHYVISAYANAEGRLLGIDCEASVDAGAYSVYPTSAALEAGMIPSLLPGPYDFSAYRCSAAAQPTSARSCLIAASPDRAYASRSNSSWMPLAGRSASNPMKCGCATWCDRIALQGGGYQLDWRVGSSGYRGSGTLVGNLLTVDWGSSTPVIYALGPDGRLTGLWEAGRGEEILTPER